MGLEGTSFARCRAGPAGRAFGGARKEEGQIQRGEKTRPSQPDERKSFYPTTSPRAIEREARVSRPKAANVTEKPTLLSHHQRREPPTQAARVSRGLVPRRTISISIIPVRSPHQYAPKPSDCITHRCLIQERQTPHAKFPCVHECDQASKSNPIPDFRISSSVVISIAGASTRIPPS